MSAKSYKNQALGEAWRSFLTKLSTDLVDIAKALFDQPLARCF
jgi:hypothetical protein